MRHIIRNVPQAIFLRDKCFSMFCSRIVSKNGCLGDLCSIFYRVNVQNCRQVQLWIGSIGTCYMLCVNALFNYTDGLNIAVLNSIKLPQAVANKYSLFCIYINEFCIMVRKIRACKSMFCDIHSSH